MKMKKHFLKAGNRTYIVVAISIVLMLTVGVSANQFVQADVTVNNHCAACSSAKTSTEPISYKEICPAVTAYGDMLIEAIQNGYYNYQMGRFGSECGGGSIRVSPSDLKMQRIQNLEQILRRSITGSDNSGSNNLTNEEIVNRIRALQAWCEGGDEPYWNNWRPLTAIAFCTGALIFAASLPYASLVVPFVELSIITGIGIGLIVLSAEAQFCIDYGDQIYTFYQQCVETLTEG